MTAPEPLTADEVALVVEVADDFGHGNQVDVANALTRLLALAESHAAMVARVGALADEWGAEDTCGCTGCYSCTRATHDLPRLRAALGGIDDGEGSR